VVVGDATAINFMGGGPGAAAAWFRPAKVVRTRIVEAVMIENDNITVGDATKAREVQSMIPDHNNQVNLAEVASSNSN
jgi:hypothetical protein